jgi:septation ring formation regulator EzrA
MTVSPYDTFENDVEIYKTVEKNKSKIIDYVSQPDLWNTPIKKSNSKIKELV